MCGRYTLTYGDLGAVADLLGALLDPAAIALHHPRFNVAPTNACVIAVPGEAQPALVPAVWGLKLAGRFVINLRSETSAGRVRALRARAVVPADGFYEWRGEKAHRQPVWFHDPAGQPLFMAGVLHEDAGGGPPAFAVLTAAARAPVAALHDRMPVLFSAASARLFLTTPGELSGDAVALVATEVSPRVNAVAHDDPACLEPPPRAGQLRLF
jgi:putative SOS response-associated peptidase YedK